MELIVDGVRCGDCVRTIVDALLQVDLGARVNVGLQGSGPEERAVRIEGRMSLDQAKTVIEHGGFKVAAVRDASVRDASVRWRPQAAGGRAAPAW